MPNFLEVVLITNHNASRLLLVGLAAAQLILGISMTSVFVVLSPTAVRASELEVVPVPAPTPIDLDLTSTIASFPAPKFVQDNPVSIMVGGEAVVLTPTSVLTPGERLAAYQVFSSGQQSIVLGALGNALGGSFNIGPKFGQYVNSLVVPEGVTAIQNAATSATLNLVGSLTNAGTFYAVSNNPAFMTASISALNIVNQPGALLTTVLPVGGISGFNGALAGLNLNLSAMNNIINSGTISSAGALSLYAGGTITNALPIGIDGPNATLMSVNQLTMQASSIVNAGQILVQQGALNVYTANLTNSGMMQSLLADLSVRNILGNTLSVTNTFGTMQALNSINFQTLSTNSLGKASLNLTGGMLTAQAINLISPDGIIHVDADTISGVMDISGGEARVGVNQGNLSIASLILTGDPVIYNTNGDVIIDVSMLAAALSTPGQDWTFLAGGNIVGGAGMVGQTFDTGSGTNGLLTLAAGVTFTPAGGAGTVTVPGGAVPFTINALASATGGNISLSGINLRTDGRDVMLLARGVSTGNPGTIEIGDISASGLGTRPAGNISLGASGAITAGKLTSIGGTGLNGGTISVTTPQTILVDSIISIGGAGAIGVAGGLGGNLTFSGPGSITVTGTITSSGGTGGDGSIGGVGGAGGAGGIISLDFTGNIGGQQILSSGGDGGMAGAGAVGIPGGVGGAGGAAGGITLKSGGDIATVATLSIGGDGGVGGAGDPGGAGGLGGIGGDISIVAAVDVLADTVISFGGLGGVGGIGNTTGAGGVGGAGGAGGVGGNIALQSSGRDINASQIVSMSGFGGAGATGYSGAAGGNGGAGGAGGSSAATGSISLNAVRDIVVEQIVAIGGDGGAGANGSSGTAGGNGGAGGQGGTSSKITVTAGRSSATGEVVTLGGFGGIGGTGWSIGAGGGGGAGGGAGTGGNISVTTTSLDVVGYNFISTGGVGGAAGNGNSSAAGGTGGAGGGGSVGGDISLVAGRDATVCCVISTGGIGGAGGSGQSIGAGGIGGAAGGGGRGGDLSITVGGNSLVDKLTTIGGTGGAGGAGGVGAAGGAGSLGGRGGDISVTATGTIFKDIITSTGGLGGAAGMGTPPGAAGGSGISGAIALTSANPVINFVALDCIACAVQLLDAGQIQSSFRTPIMNAVTGNTIIGGGNVFIQVNVDAVLVGPFISSGNINRTAPVNMLIIGNIISTGAVNNTISLTAGGSIIVCGGTPTSNLDSTGVNTGMVRLTAIGGNIGSSAAPILTAASILQAASAGDVYIRQTGSTILVDSFAGSGNIFDITTAADGGGNGMITINGLVAAISGTIGTLNLTSTETGAGAGGIAWTSGQIVATNIHLLDGPSCVGTGDIGTLSGRIQTVATNLTANTVGNVYLNNTGSVTLGVSGAGNGLSFDLITTADSGGNGQITINGGIACCSGTIGTINLTSTESGVGFGGIVETAGLLVATSINLKDGGTSGTGDIGTATARVLTVTSNLTTSGVANVFVSNSGSVTLLVSYAGNTKILDVLTTPDSNTNGAITVDGGLSAGTINLTTSAIGNGDININANATASSNLTFSAGGSGAITQSAEIVLTAPTVSLTSGTGSIGTVTQNIGTAAFTHLTANTGGTGNVYINQTGAVTLGASTAGGTFKLTDNGSTLTLGGNVIVMPPGANAIGGTIIIQADSFLVDNGGGAVHVYADGVGSGSGGSVTLVSSSITATGDIWLDRNSASGIAISTISGAGTAGNGGTAFVQAGHDLNIYEDGLHTDSHGTNSNGGNVTLNSVAGTINFYTDVTLQLNGQGAGNGGSLSIAGPSIVTAENTRLGGEGGAIGNGGTTTINVTGSNDFSIGTGASDFQITTAGGSFSGNSGSISVSVGRNLTINPGGLSLTPTSGNGATLNLAAGTAVAGNLYILGDISSNGTGTGNGGSVSLVSNSSTAFIVGSSARTNGIIGNIAVVRGADGATDGSISMQNNGGDVAIYNALSANALTLNAGSGATNGSINIYNSLTGTSSVSITANGSGVIQEFRPAMVTSLITNGVTNYTSGRLVLNSAGTQAYSIAVTGEILVVNPTTGTVLSTLTGLPTSPTYLAIDSVNNRLYLSGGGLNVYVVNIAGASPVLVETLILSGPTGGVVVTPGGSNIYVATNDAIVTPITTANYASYSVGVPITVDTGATGVGVNNVALDSSGRYLYTINLVSQRSSVIDTQTNVVLSGTGGFVPAINVGSGPVDMAANGGYMYVANILSHDVYVINTSSRTVVSANGITAIPLDAPGTMWGSASVPVGIAVSTNGNFAYTVNQTTNTVSVINTATQIVVETIALAGSPSGIVMSPNGESYLVSLPGTSQIATIGLAPRIIGGIVSLTSGSGNIGAAATPIRTFATTLSLTTGGNTFIDQTGAVNLGTSNVTGNLQLAAGHGSITVNGAIVAGGLNLTTTTNNNIAIGANINATGSVLLSALGAGNITWTAGTITAPTVNLFSGSGNIGTDLSNIQTVAVNLSANTSGAGNVYITNTGSVNLIDSTAGNTFQLINNGANNIVTTTGHLTVGIGGTITISSGAGTNGSIAIEAKVLAPSGIVNFSFDGNGTFTNTPQPGVSTRVIANNSTTSYMNYSLSGTANAYAVALDSEGKVAFVTSQDPSPRTAGSVYIVDIDPASGTYKQIVGTIAVGNNPVAVTVRPDGKFLYVANRYSNSISIIDIQPESSTYKTVVATVTLAAGAEPFGIAFNPAVGSTQAYVTVVDGIGAATPSYVQVLTWAQNPVGDVLEGTISLPSGPVYAAMPKSVVFNPAGSAAYVANQFNRMVSVIATGTNTLGSNINVGDGPIGMAVTTIGGIPIAYVSNISDNTVSVINLNTNTVIQTIAVGNNPLGVSVAGNFVYVANSGSNTVSVIDTSLGNKIVATVPVGAAPVAYGNFAGIIGGKPGAVIANSGAGTVSLLDSSPALIDPLLVTITGGSGALGTASQPITIATDKLRINTVGNVFVKISDATELVGSRVGGTLELTSNANVKVSGIEAGALKISTVGQLVLAGDITARGGSISLSGASVSLVSKALVIAYDGSVFVQSGTNSLIVSPTSSIAYSGGTLSAISSSQQNYATTTSNVSSQAVLPGQTALTPATLAPLNSTSLTCPVCGSGVLGLLNSRDLLGLAAIGNFGLSSSLAPAENTGMKLPSMGILDEKAPSGGAEEEPRKLLPVSWSAPLANDMSLLVETSSLKILKLTGSSAKRLIVRTVTGGLIELTENNREVLLIATGNTKMLNNGFEVMLSPGVIALVAKINGVMHVNNLWGQGRHSITVSHHGRIIAQLSPGQEILLGPSSVILQGVINKDPVAHRRISCFDISDKAAVLTSDFSFVSLIQHSPALIDLFHTESRAERILASKIEKMAACISMILDRKYGPYQSALNNLGR